MQPITRRRAIGGALAIPAAAAFAGTAQATSPHAIDLFFPVPVQGQLAHHIEAAIHACQPPGAVIMSANFVREYVINNEVDPFDPLIEKEGKTPAVYMDNFW